MEELQDVYMRTWELLRKYALNIDSHGSVIDENLGRLDTNVAIAMWDLVEAIEESRRPQI